MDCAGCGAIISDDSRFCPQCGAPQRSGCPACGHANLPGARFCSQCGARLEAAPAEKPASAPVTTAERRQVTVMFCDLVGSTALATRLDPEDLREVIGAYHRCAAETVARFHGFVAQYLGDGVLVYFGYPEAREDDAEQAVRSALALAAAVPALKPRGEAGLAVRIGIATGLVVVGDLVGTGPSAEHKIVGETPNLAARLQTLAAPNAVVIAESTRRLLGALFEVEDMGAVALKGFAAPAQVFRVRGEGAVDGRFEALRAAALTPLVGREEEIELLLRRWQQARRGAGRVVLLSGEPGIGKSRLVAALHERLETEPHIRLRYFCSPHHQDSAFYPTIAQLERAAGFERGDTPDARFAKLEALLAPASASAEDVALLAELLSLPLPSRYPPLALSPPQRKARTFEALFRQLESLARAKPVVATFDDVHWMDPTSRELLDLIVDRVRGLPVLLLLTFRPEFQPPWTGQSHVTTMVLSRLDRSEGAVLVARIAAANGLPPEVVAAIVARTDGVPLFVEEMTKAMVEAGASQSHAPLPERAVPATLHASLMARLDRLGTAAKEVAQIGAVIGREFPYELLAAVAPGGGGALAAPLAQLVEAGLISQRGTPPDAMFLFKHALVQDAAYGTLLRDHRRNLHARIARVLHSGFPESAETVPEILARHFTEAGDVVQAIGYWYKAGEKSTRQSANREAIAQLKTGLRLVDQVPDADERHDWELRLLVALGPALMATMSSAEPEVTQTYARARQLAQQKARSAELFQALWGSWLAAFSTGDLRGAGTLVEELFAIAQAEGSAELTFQAHHAAWPTLLSQGNLHGAQQSLDAGLPLYRRDAYRHHALMYGGHDPGVCGRGLSGMNLALLGRLDRALGDARETLALAQGLDHRPTLAHGYWLAAEAHYLRRDVASVRELADAMLALAVEHGTSLAVANAKMFRGWALAASGSVAEGIASAQAGLSAWQATGSKFHGPYRLARVADALILGDRIDDALAVLAAASAMAAQTGEHWFDAEVARLAAMARLRSAGADRQQAERHLRHAVASAHACGAQLIELRAATSLAALLHDQGRRGEAFDLLLPVHGRFSEGFDTPDLVAAQALIDHLR